MYMKQISDLTQICQQQRLENKNLENFFLSFKKEVPPALFGSEPERRGDLL
jgi:hypothetical protein